MKKHVLLVFALFFLVCMLHAQTMQEDFEKYRQHQQTAYSDYTQEMQERYNHFRDSCNAAFADFLSRSWERFVASPDIPPPPSIEPITPIVVEPDKKPTADPLPVDKVTPSPEPMPRPEPVVPVVPPNPEMPEIKHAFSFSFYNTECKVRIDNSLRFSLSGVAEKDVAQAWTLLSGKQYDALLYDCLALRDQLNLCDWGYLQLLIVMSEKFFNKTSNEAVLLQMFLLTQSGYKVRIARTDNRLALLVPFYQSVYRYSFLNIRGIRYYVINRDLQGKSFNICDQEFPKEQFFSWQTRQPRLTEQLNQPKTFASIRYPEIQASIQTNQNLMDFYGDYPFTAEYNVYVSAGLSETVKRTLYPVLQNAIAGKTKTEAANILIDFCQTAFDYKTCAEQFGYERQFFADENFFFPYNNM